jgi:hypothetical protein
MTDACSLLFSLLTDFQRSSDLMFLEKNLANLSSIAFIVKALFGLFQNLRALFSSNS